MKISIRIKALCFLLCAGTLANAGTNAWNISSRPVGFVRINLSFNEQKLVSLPFHPFDPAISAIFAGQDQPDAVLRWDNISLSYEQAYRAVNKKFYSDPWKGVESAMAVFPGEGFIVWNKQECLSDVFLAGEVILEATNTVELGRSLSIIGYPFSSAGASAGIVSNSFVMADGYWFNNTSSVAAAWIEVRPYDDVFPAEGENPAITGLSIKNAKEAVLTIEPSGTIGEKLDIYYKDVMSSTGCLDTVSGWLIAEQDISVNGRKTIEWCDSGDLSRLPVNEVFGRYYLAGRSDVLGSDGIPLCRRRFTGGSFTDSFASVPPGREDSGKEENSSLNSSAGIVHGSDVHRTLSSSALRCRTIYVDCNIGGDKLSGKAAMVVGTEGPKKTVNGAFKVAKNGDTIIVKPGVYSEKVVVPDGIRLICEGRVTLDDACDEEHLDKGD